MSRAEIQAFPYHPKSMRRPPSASELPTLLLHLAAPSPHCSFPLLPSSYVSSSVSSSSSWRGEGGVNIEFKKGRNI